MQILYNIIVDIIETDFKILIQGGMCMFTNGVSNASTGKRVSYKVEHEKKQQGIKSSEYGAVYGEPKLSDDAKKYYDTLKSKFSDMDFVLVSKDELENAKANAGRFANANRMVVLIDEDKLEKMATDEEYRKKYEGIIAMSRLNVSQIKEKLPQNITNVKTFGVEIGDNGAVKYFAVLDKSMQAQRERIEEKAKERSEEKKAEKKERLEKENDKRLHKDDKKNVSSDVVISANSVEELIKKLKDYAFSELSDSVITKEETYLGNSIDFSV